MDLGNAGHLMVFHERKVKQERERQGKDQDMKERKLNRHLGIAVSTGSWTHHQAYHQISPFQNCFQDL